MLCGCFVAGVGEDTLKKPGNIELSVSEDSQNQLAASHRPPTLRYPMANYYIIIISEFI